MLKLASALVCLLGIVSMANAGDMIEEGTNAVRAILFDPGAAQFANVREVQYNGTTVVCGKVNGKNKFGGYVGTKPFLYEATRKEPIIYEGSEITADYISQIARVDGYKKVCGN